MRVLIFAGGGDIGGGKTHILSLARRLSAENDIRLVSFREGAFAQEAKEAGIDTVTVDHHRGILHSINVAKEQVKSFKPDIVHCHGSKANMLGVIVKRAFHVPLVTTVHSDPDLDYMGKPFRKYTFGTINAYALKHMDFYIAVADDMHELLLKRGYNPRNIFTIYNGIDFSTSQQYPRTFKQQYDVINVGIAARLNPVKDISTLIRAFAIAYKRNTRLRLHIAGVGEDEAKLRQLAKDLKIEDVVYFDGWQSDVKAFFKNIDINVLSSLSETFPYSLLEGAYEHCPAIASDAGGIPWLIKHGVTGLMFKCGDAETFASHILTLSRDESYRRELAENLYEFARENFDLSVMAARQQDIYTKIIQRENSTRRYGAVICGAYGRENTGDEAILKSIIGELRSIDENIPVTVMSKSPQLTRKNFSEKSIYIFNPFTFIRELKRSKLFISGGGSLIQDVTSSRSLYFYLLTLLEAKKQECKVMMYGCGIGPILRKSHKKTAAKIINKTADVITLRDEMSKKLLEKIGVDKPEIILSADPTFSLAHIDSEKINEAFLDEGIDGNEKLLGLCLRKWKSFSNLQAVSKAVDYAYKTYGLIPVFMAIENPKDIAIAEEIASLLPRSTPRYICRKVHPDSEFIGMLSKMEAVCGMRLHSLIFAAAAGTASFALSYDVKVDGFFKDTDNDKIVDVSSVSFSALKEFIDICMQEGKTESMNVYYELREREKENVRQVRRLLSE